MATMVASGVEVSVRVRCKASTLTDGVVQGVAEDGSGEEQANEGEKIQGTCGCTLWSHETMCHTQDGAPMQAQRVGAYPSRRGCPRQRGGSRRGETA